AAALRYAEALGPILHRLVRIATRVQGIVVAPGNPAGIRDVSDLARLGLRFVNRQRDSGTRFLFDQLLKRSGIDPAAIRGYENEELTHGAVAAHVASGSADAGIAIQAAATQFGLDFVPIVKEHYYLAVHRDLLLKPEVEYLLGLLRGNAFHDAVESYHGD